MYVSYTRTYVERKERRNYEEGRREEERERERKRARVETRVEGSRAATFETLDVPLAPFTRVSWSSDFSSFIRRTNWFLGDVDAVRRLGRSPGDVSSDDHACPATLPTQWSRVVPLREILRRRSGLVVWFKVKTSLTHAQLALRCVQKTLLLSFAGNERKGWKNYLYRNMSVNFIVPLWKNIIELKEYLEK